MIGAKAQNKTQNMIKAEGRMAMPGQSGTMAVPLTSQATFSFRKAAKEEKEEAKKNKPRSSEYILAMNLIDYLSENDWKVRESLRGKFDKETAEIIAVMSDEEILDYIKTNLVEEFGGIDTPLELEGVISKCYIKGCDVHAIDRKGNIIKHFTEGVAMKPESLEIGRRAFYHYPECECVEVYKKGCKIIMNDGTVINEED